ncbi:MAG TPA: PP2C family protein-serine/threonine phosphatase [Candidatus Acidoferrum sp.]|jgi:serine phosphatase RsbU (regulator of sigma subunit)|nr:PP2C family protein-serine/threonine phosphatase [Candidatus Acidoferrum sp.]
MSTAAPPPPAASEPRPAPTTRLGNFWQRVSEGRRIDDLWSQFAADARSSYGFYGKDVDWDEVNQLPRWKRPYPVVKQLFWAMMNKLTPARRVLLLVALVLLLLSGNGNHTGFDIKAEFLSALLFLLLLSLELADKITMKRDLEIAREIQAWLVPSTPPAIPNAEVAFYTRAQNSVAGDYYDAFYPLEDASAGGKLMLVMADVAGKSVPAALLMATLQASLRTIASEGLPLSELAIRLNHYACAHSLGGQRFTTAVLAEYDPATRRLSYVNAGHNSPVIRRANSSTERLESGSLPLGITPEATFPSSEVTLQTGDTLVLFTDGVVEAFNASGEEFSDNRWLNIIRGLPNLNAQQTLQFLIKSVEDFVGATRQSDDITCLVLRCY